MSDKLPPVDHAWNLVVQPHHIKEAARTSVHKCPIALALKEAFPTLVGVRVGESYTWLTIQDESGALVIREYLHDAERFVHRFDAGLPVVSLQVRFTPRAVPPEMAEVQDWVLEALTIQAAKTV